MDLFASFAGVVIAAAFCGSHLFPGATLPQPTPPQPPSRDDVSMDFIPTGPEYPSNNDLSDVVMQDAFDLRHRNQTTLSAEEKRLKQIRNNIIRSRGKFRRRVQEAKESKQTRVKRSDSLVDQVMASPSPQASHSSLPSGPSTNPDQAPIPQSPPPSPQPSPIPATPASTQSSCAHARGSRWNASTASDSSPTNARHEPYTCRRPHGQRRNHPGYISHEMFVAMAKDRIKEYCEAYFLSKLSEKNRDPLDETTKNETQRVAAARNDALQLFEVLNTGLDNMLRQYDSFSSAWNAFTNRFDLSTTPPQFREDPATSIPSSTSSQAPSSPGPFPDPSIPDGSDPGVGPSKASSSGKAPSGPSLSSSSSSRVSSPYSYKCLPAHRPRSVVERFARYKSDWLLLKSPALKERSVSIERMPWPVLFDVKRDKLHRINLNSIRAFLFHPERKIAKRDMQIFLKRELTRWHVDKLITISPKYVPEEETIIVEVATRVAKLILEIYKAEYP
ncbi:hypothetical protein NP233_g3223 [Leucocoprinus birnbaumii]|uniref:Uncharacterized protein n=1 Tax=Leucocoprinus birnbaumii TaxID=56174 RepID=A0AAD5YYH5_9AGAR|nr:hypothetical protein NP233_g3223 [Leucocoprinus birnbaumii]